MTSHVELGYLDEDYLVFPYLGGRREAGLAAQLTKMQQNSVAVQLHAYSVATAAVGVQMRVSNLGHLQCEDMGYLDEDYLSGPYLAACLIVGLGVELSILNRRGLAVQLTVRNYNDVLMRVLYDIPSRGDDGLSWTASSTMPSGTNSFIVNNINDDIEEHTWRSATGVVTGIQLNCNTGNRIAIDTFFMRNHNLTTGAVVELLESDDPTFTTGVVSTLFLITVDKEFLYIASTPPISGYLNQRLDIDDPTNPDGYIEIGVLGFGEAEIFEEPVFALPVEYENVEYVDTVQTAAYTNIMNLRAARKQLRLQINNVVYGSQDWQRWQRIFDYVGKTLKALWIPIPETPYRFTTFSKLKQLPRYSHNSIGRVGGVTADYVKFTVETDEAL